METNESGFESSSEPMLFFRAQKQNTIKLLANSCHTWSKWRPQFSLLLTNINSMSATLTLSLKLNDITHTARTHFHWLRHLIGLHTKRLMQVGVVACGSLTTLCVIYLRNKRDYSADNCRLFIGFNLQKPSPVLWERQRVEEASWKLCVSSLVERLEISTHTHRARELSAEEKEGEEVEVGWRWISREVCRQSNSSKQWGRKTKVT